MRTVVDGSSSAPVPTPKNAFDPDFLTRAHSEEEPLTAAEADLSGPWKIEPLHPGAGFPGAVAVVRAWESTAEGDLPEAVFLHPETATLCAALLSLIEREPLFYLDDQPASPSPMPEGYPLLAMYGEQGPAVRGWFRRFRPELATALHLLEGLVRSPYHLAALADAAGAGALAHFGRRLAELLATRQGEGRQPDEDEAAERS